MSLARRRRRIVVSVLNVVAAILIVAFLATGGGTSFAEVFPSAIEVEDDVAPALSDDGRPGSAGAGLSGPVTSIDTGRGTEPGAAATSVDEVDARVSVVDDAELAPARAGATLGRSAADGGGVVPATVPPAPSTPTVSTAQSSATSTVSEESTPSTAAAEPSDEGSESPSGPPTTTAATSTTMQTTTTAPTLTVVVPDVVGQQHRAAVATVRAADLGVAVCGDACQSIISAQSPSSGSTVPAGTIVTFSLAAEQATVPPVVGLTGSDAVAVLVAAGLGSSCGSRCAEFVAATNPGQGSVVDASSFVTLRF